MEGLDAGMLERKKAITELRRKLAFMERAMSEPDPLDLVLRDIINWDSE
jgi:hypothetical protein